MTLYIIRDDTVTAYRFGPSQGFGRRVAGPIGKRYRDQRVVECTNGRDLERAAGDGAGCQVQGPEHGGAAALGGFRPIAGQFGAGRRFGRTERGLEAGPGHRAAATAGRSNH